MPIGRQPTDPRLLAALPKVQAYMDRHGHKQKDVVRLAKTSQPQVSKFLSGERKRVTKAVLAICQYAEVDLNSALPQVGSTLHLSQAARRVLEDNPRAAELAALLIEAMAPVLSTLPKPTATLPKEVP